MSTENKKNVITRKVQLSFDCPKEQLKDKYTEWFRYNRICASAANHIATHMFAQESVKDMFYFTDETKKKLADIAKDENGILNTSKQNTTYQMLSSKFKGDCPMAILTALNSVVTSSINKCMGDIKNGKISLPSYRNDIPMPMMSSNFRNLLKSEDGNYQFSCFGTQFKTYFGKDLSNNEFIFDMALKQKEYKFCDSSFQFEKKGGKWKLFLLAVFSFASDVIEERPNEIICELDVMHPIIIKGKKEGKDFYIGTQEDYLHGRLAIQGAYKRLKVAAKYNKGGKGRTKKLANLSVFQEKEKNFVAGKMHVYSRQLINYCLKNKVGKIILSNYHTVKEECKNDKLLLPSWSYFNLAGKIQYKAAIHGIQVIIPKEIETENGKEICV